MTSPSSSSKADTPRQAGTVRDVFGVWLLGECALRQLFRYRSPLLWPYRTVEFLRQARQALCTPIGPMFRHWLKMAHAGIRVLGTRLVMPRLPRLSLLPVKKMRLRRLFVFATASFCTVAGAAVLTYAQEILQTLPIVNAESLRPSQSIRILDRDGHEIYRIYDEEDRVTVKSGDIPEHMKDAAVAIEDERFFSRPCIDIRALLRAALANATDYKSQGASTITQQLVRNIYLTREKRVTRKIQELILACRLENDLTRDEILTMYLNRIPFGHSIYGVRQASMTYFGVEPNDLTLAQSAVLAALPQRPSYYSPYGSHVKTVASREVLRDLRKGTLEIEDLSPSDYQIGLIGHNVETGSGKTVLLNGRSTLVLGNMLRLGYISQEEHDSAVNELDTIAFQPPGGTKLEAAHFALLIRDKVQDMMRDKGEEDSWQKAGLSVVTTLDSRLQKIAEEAITELFPAIAKKNNAENIALVALDRNTREVVAYVGSSDYFDETTSGKIDMVQAPRQPGSSFKPLVYAASFLKGYTAKTIIQDTPLKIGTASPKNYDGTFKGAISIRTALAWSRNIPAIRAFQHAGGEDAVLSVASAAGITTPEERRATLREDGVEYSYGWPLALGSAEVPLWEMVQAYATLAESGSFLPIRTIRNIDDSDGQTLYIMPGVEPKQGIPAKAAGEVAAILSDERSRPAGFWRQQLTIPNIKTGVKTGTSNVCFRRLANGTCVRHGVNNTWTIGFTDDLVVGVWVGNADNTALAPKADGLTTAAPIWKRFLMRAHATKKPLAVQPGV